ncbi:transmembrane protein 238-like [Pelodytes ibericus]
MTLPRRPIGRCPVFFVLAVCFDVFGLSLVLIGIFVNFQIDGRNFGEFIIYSGGIMVFFSLLWWLAWYSLNLEVSLQDLLMDPPESTKRSNLVQLARKFSERFSKSGKRKRLSKEPVGTPHLSGDRLHLTPSAFINNGFNNHLTSPKSIESHLELITVCQESCTGLGSSQTAVDRLV